MAARRLRSTARTAGPAQRRARRRCAGCRTRCPPGRRAPASPSRRGCGGPRPAWRPARALARPPRRAAMSTACRSRWTRLRSCFASGTSMNRIRWRLVGGEDHVLLVPGQVRVVGVLVVAEQLGPPDRLLVGVEGVERRVRYAKGHGTTLPGRDARRDRVYALPGRSRRAGGPTHQPGEHRLRGTGVPEQPAPVRPRAGRGRRDGHRDRRTAGRLARRRAPRVDAALPPGGQRDRRRARSTPRSSGCRTRSGSTGSSPRSRRTRWPPPRSARPATSRARRSGRRGSAATSPR